MQAPQQYLRQKDRSLVTHWLMALENQTYSDSSLSPQLARFIAPFVNRLCFRFAGSLIVGIIDEKTFQP